MKIYITTKDIYNYHQEEPERVTIIKNKATYYAKKYKDGYLFFDTNVDKLEKELRTFDSTLEIENFNFLSFVNR